MTTFASEHESPSVCACVGCPHKRNCRCHCEECYQEEHGLKPKTPQHLHVFELGQSVGPKMPDMESGVPD